MRMLEEEINAGGGIDGRKIRLIIRDTEGNLERAKTLAEDLIDEGVIAIIGPSTSGETMAIKDLCQKKKMVLVSCGIPPVTGRERY